MRPLVFSSRFVLGILLTTIALGQTTTRSTVDALEKYRRDLEANPRSSLAHYRIAEIFCQQRNLERAANEFRWALNGDSQPAWTEAWAHINLGMMFDLTVQRLRAIDEYRQAQRVVARKKIEHPGPRVGSSRQVPEVTVHVAGCNANAATVARSSQHPATVASATGEITR